MRRADQRRFFVVGLFATSYAVGVASVSDVPSWAMLVGFLDVTFFVLALEHIYDGSDTSGNQEGV